MALKKMYLANYNITFGSNDEPLLNWLEGFVIPALNSGIKRTLTSDAKIMFRNVKMEEIVPDELVLTGIIIKDTMVDILNEYDDSVGLLDKDEHYKTAPYSFFMIFLKNHRMVLIKRQTESPDLRLFTSTTQEVLKLYRKEENQKRKVSGVDLLPYAVMGIKDIKSMDSVSEALKFVKKITKFTLKITPSNNELPKQMDNIISGLDEDIRKKTESKILRVVVQSPQSKKGVEEIISETNGLAETELEVEYMDDDYENETTGVKRKSRGKIRDNQMSQAMDANLPDNLLSANKEIYSYCSKIDSLNIETPNIIDYKKYLENRKR